MGVHVLDAVIRDWLEDHPSTLSLEGPRRRAMNRVLVWNRGLKVSWSTSNNKATATQTPSKVFFPAAFWFTVSLQQKRAKRQSSCSSFFPLVGHPTSPQSFTHKNKNNSKKKHTHTQTHKYIHKAGENLCRREKKHKFHCRAKVHQKSNNPDCRPSSRTPPQTENFRKCSNFSAKRKTGKKNTEWHTHSQHRNQYAASCALTEFF